MSSYIYEHLCPSVWGKGTWHVAVFRCATRYTKAAPLTPAHPLHGKWQLSDVTWVQDNDEMTLRYWRKSTSASHCHNTPQAMRQFCSLLMLGLLGCNACGLARRHHRFGVKYCIHLQGVTTQKMNVDIFTAVWTLFLRFLCFSCKSE
jgi:hypothetical protein